VIKISKITTGLIDHAKKKGKIKERLKLCFEKKFF
jgi:hypothetical protein